MKKKKKNSNKGALVRWYAEDLGARLLEVSEEAFQRALGRKSGVYVLSRGDKPYYVGLASTLRKRLPKHRKDHLRNKWDRFSFYSMKNKYIKDVETLLIRVADPDGNEAKGHFGKNRNLKSKLKTWIKQEFNELIGAK
ncbi:MAG: hypothetical protein WB997_04895 [Candidatus Acidiferrales bacterium]